VKSERIRDEVLESVQIGSSRFRIIRNLENMTKFNSKQISNLIINLSVSGLEVEKLLH